MPDVTEHYARIQVRPASDFEADTLRTMLLNGRDGIKAVVGETKSGSTAVSAYLFDKGEYWDDSRDKWARSWVEKNKGRYTTRDFLGRAAGYSGDPILRVILAGDSFRLEEPSEWERISAGQYDEFKTKDERPFDHVELDDNGVPTAFRIVAFGPWETSKYGTLKVSELTAKGTMAWWAYKWGDEKVPMDWGHRSASGEDERSPGYWKPEIRDDGIWAVDVEWTPRGYEQLQAKEIKFFSPEGKLNAKTKEVLAVTYIALTNRPATNHQKPLVASDATATPAPAQEVIPMKELLKKLGLAENATEDEAIAKLEELTLSTPEAVETAHKEAIEAKDAEIAALKADDKLAEFRAETLKACDLGDDADFAKVLAKIETLKAKAPEADKVSKLEAKIEVLEKAREDGRIEKLLASVSTKIVPAKKATIEKLARTLDADEFMATMADWPDIKGASPTPAAVGTINARNEDPAAHECLNDADRSFFASKGWDPKTDAGKKEIQEYISVKVSTPAIG